MPSKSPKQARLMAMRAHRARGGNEERYKSCPKGAVAKEFNKADKGGPLLKRKRK